MQRVGDGGSDSRKEKDKNDSSEKPPIALPTVPTGPPLQWNLSQIPTLPPELSKEQDACCRLYLK